MFSLHAQLERDTVLIAELALSRALLMNNRLFPWIILVPRVEHAHELVDLKAHSRHLLMDEIALASAALKQVFAPDRLNVAALGNQVPQLHVHVIARFKTDAAWPQPVWGRGVEAYGDPEPVRQRLAQALLPAHAS